MHLRSFKLKFSVIQGISKKLPLAWLWGDPLEYVPEVVGSVTGYWQLLKNKKPLTCTSSSHQDSFVGKNIHNIPSHPGGGGLPISPIYLFPVAKPPPPRPLGLFFENQRRLRNQVAALRTRMWWVNKVLVVGASSAGTNRVTLNGLISATRIFLSWYADLPPCYSADLLPVRWNFRLFRRSF